MSVDALRTLEHAGKYLVKTRNLITEARTFTATAAAESRNPDVQALAVLSVLVFRVGAALSRRMKHDGWVDDICEALNLPGGE